MHENILMRNAAQLVECLPSMHEALALMLYLALYELHVVHTIISALQELYNIASLKLIWVI